MTLGQKQRLFSKLIAQLILTAYGLGYEVTFGDFYRDPRLHGGYRNSGGYGSAKSLHKLRLAADLNLFKDGKYLDKTEDHEELGKIWMAMHPMCEWGGHGNRNDGNHYSFRHDRRW
jgi:hypothetical protein